MELKVYIEELKEGNEIEFVGSIPSLDLLSQEENLRFSDCIQVEGHAYLAGDHLMIHLEASAEVWQPCTICNAFTPSLIHPKGLQYVIPLEEIPSGVFDFSESLRSDLLLEIPAFVECGGNCPERESLKKILQNKRESDHSQFPFAGL